MDIFRDPIWQFWGVVIGILTMISGFVIYLLQRNKKRLTYHVLTETALLSIDDAIKGRIEIKYEKKKIQNIHLLIIKIENTGNIPIPSTDYEKSIIFSFPNSEVLSVEVTETSPKNLNPTIGKEISNITINPILLNKKDYIVFKMLLAEYAEKIDVESHIVGVKEIERVNKGDKFASNTTMLNMALSGAIITGIWFFQIYSTSPDTYIVGNLFFIILSIVTSSFVISMVIIRSVFGVKD